MNKRSLFKSLLLPGRCFQSKHAKLLWLSGACGALALVLISCTTSNQTVVAPPGIAGATFVGSKACADCHQDVTRDFKTADHARIMAKGKNAENEGCESCHGPGSLHVQSGGAPNTIINPHKDPETCFQCHLEIRAKFTLPNHHGVLEGKISCSDCHNPHKGSIYKGGGATNMMGRNEVCFQCHIAQRGPFVYPHEAMREGCVTCHDPHGSVNEKMLKERNQLLCLQCHFQQQTSPGTLNIGNSNHATGRIEEGTCWSAGCHEAVHGSQVNSHLRY
jgi:predicted CXXCH cytochrome family protein